MNVLRTVQRCSDLLSRPGNTRNTEGLLSSCMYVEQRTEPTTTQPPTFVVKMSRVGLRAATLIVILQLLVKISSLCWQQISAENKQLEGDLLAGYVISLSVLLESWTDLSG